MKEIIIKNVSVPGAPTWDFSRSYLERIYDDLDDIRHGFIRLGFHLNEIKKCRFYESAGYSDFYLFCEDNYKLKATTVKRYIEVWYRFSSDNDGIHTMFINEKYRGYNYSQLCEMVSMKDPDIVRPDMTIQQIRELKKKKDDKSIVKCDVAPVEIACRFNDDFSCNIDEVQRKHFMKNGNIIGCAGCCNACLDRKTCKHVCAAVSHNKCDTATAESDVVIENKKATGLDDSIHDAFILLGMYDDLLLNISHSDHAIMDTLLKRLLDKLATEKYDDAFLICRNLLAYIAFRSRSLDF